MRRPKNRVAGLQSDTCVPPNPLWMNAERKDVDMKGREHSQNRASSTHTAEVDKGLVGAGVLSAFSGSIKKVRQTSSHASDAPSEPNSHLIPECIAERARALWLASGCAPGRDEQNWREAEAQLRAESKSD